MKKHRWVAAALVGAVVAVVGVGAVMAQTGGSSDSTGSTFLDRVAEKLGIESPKLKDAVTSVRNDDIDNAVKNGDLTQQQADSLKQKLGQEADPLAGRYGGHGGPFAFKGGFGFFPGPGFGLGDAESAFAGFLGISTDQLHTELQADGATLATVAQTHGKSRDEVKTFITDTAKTKLDAAVTNGDLTQKMEDNILAALTSHVDQLIDAHLPKGLGEGGFGFRGHVGPHGMGGGDNGTNPNGGSNNGTPAMPPSGTSPSPGT